jgi:mono/diheme cytochrome c family protein
MGVERPSWCPRLSGLTAILFSIVTGLHAQAQSPANVLPAGNGRDLVAVACTQCHGLKLIVALRDGPVGWKHFVDDMILRGAQLNSQEADAVAQYLAKNFGPGTSPMQSGLKTDSLPAGDGQKLVESHCAVCHDLGRITTVQRSKEEWNNTVSNMMARAGANVASQDEIMSMASYLAANFTKKTN